MQVPFKSSHAFKHPLATHSALDVLGYRRNGAPIYAIAGGNGEGEGASASDNPPAPAGSDPGTPPAPTPAPPAQPPTPAEPKPATGDDDATDWKARAREWEKRAKANSKAADELEKVRQQNMSEQEKAVAEAERKGRTAAASEYGHKLAAAEFRAAVSAAGIDLGEAADLIDPRQFVGEDGEVDTNAIKAAVKKLAKLAPHPAGKSGPDLSGGTGEGSAKQRPTSLSAAVRGSFNT
ncbi:hypothetical protein [Streptomyces adelaidensis]|uniref:hypothetical protein n=1 Tax=Streptomyces adelaidensis TaxID=2796465 RepID=UPI001904D0CD|nr:hypothetical protein [Streptomyces adelaidensis]